MKIYSTKISQKEQKQTLREPLDFIHNLRYTRREIQVDQL